MGCANLVKSLRISILLQTIGADTADNELSKATRKCAAQMAMSHVSQSRGLPRGEVRRAEGRSCPGWSCLLGLQESGPQYHRLPPRSLGAKVLVNILVFVLSL